MSTDATGPVARNKQAGSNAENACAARYPPLHLVPDEVSEHYDAILTSVLYPRPDLRFVSVCVLEPGTRVEIKSAVVRLSSGRRGKFYLRPNQHKFLVEANAAYLFAVCEGADTERNIVAAKIVPARTLDYFLDERRWLDGGEGRSDYAQIAWSRIFDPTEVER
ncbi:hypothetical protein [Haloarchaeobius sp. DFWS5]|uniref:hypothetical protein n=1 Tax=Haloarchaeobius sp. DFWS5 TaxID=3446114 RepID=UPI003EB9C93F